MTSTKVKQSPVSQRRRWLSEIPPDDLADMPVSFSGTTPWSRFGEIVWDFAPGMDRRNQYLKEARIDWSSPLINGVVLTDGDHATLLLELKLAVLSFLTRERPSLRRPPKLHTVFHGQWVCLRRFAAFVTTAGLNSLAGIKPDHYCAYYESLLSSTATVGQNVGARLEPFTMYKYAVVVNDLWNARNDVGLPKLAEPWTERRLHKYFGVRKRREATTPIIPEPAIRAMLDLALHLIEHRLLTVVQVEGAVQSISDRNEGHPGISGRKARETYHRFGYQSGNDFLREQHLCRAACIVVVLFFSGIRESELTSLQRDCYRPRDLADVPLHGVLTGQRFKGREVPEVCSWSVPTIVGAAVRGLRDLTKLIWRKQRGPQAKRKGRPKRVVLGSINLDAIRSVGALLVTRHRKKRKGHPTAMTGHVIRADLQLFSAAAQCQDEDGNPWVLSCQQFRRTFAYMIARHQLGDVRYLRHHLGHADIDMTIYYCAGSMSDNVLVDEIAEERKKLQSALVDRWLDPLTPLSGGRGREICARRIAIKTVADRQALSAVLSEDMRIRGTGHSHCLYQGEGCGGEGLYDAIRCGDCNGAVIGLEHLAIWEALEDQQQGIVDSGEFGAGLQARAAKQLEACRSVLADLCRSSP